MTADRNPQASQMADESMLRTLAAQAIAIWPQERAIFERYALPTAPRVLDVGCGSGEITYRLANLLDQAQVTGMDIIQEHLALARKQHGDRGGRLRFERADAFALPYETDAFDLTVARHILQAVPNPHLVLGEIQRVTRPGGRVHLLAEDYAMMHFHPTEWDCDLFWHDGPITYARSTGSDLRGGRGMFTQLRQAGFADVTVDYVVVDTVRVSRQVFADIWRAWRDGYSEAITEHSRFTADEVAEYWRQMIAAIEDPDGYGVWHVPVIGGTVAG